MSLMSLLRNLLKSQCKDDTVSPTSHYYYGIKIINRFNANDSIYDILWQSMTDDSSVEYCDPAVKGPAEVAMVEFEFSTKLLPPIFLWLPLIITTSRQ